MGGIIGVGVVLMVASRRIDSGVFNGGSAETWGGSDGVYDGGFPGGVMGSVGSLMLDLWTASRSLWGVGRITVGPE